LRQGPDRGRGPRGRGAGLFVRDHPPGRSNLRAGPLERRMTLSHPLDRPVWSSLTSRQAGLAQGDAWAVRLAPEYGVFAAAADESDPSMAALAAIAAAGQEIALVEAKPARRP